MSGQGTPSRAKTSPKQGPLRATIPISCVTKEGSSLRRSASPTVAPPTAAPAGRRSPGAAPAFKEKLVVCDSPMRRAASLDMIYLRGLFPREGVFWQKDRATQTEISTSLDSLQTISTAEEKLARLSLRQRRRSCSRDSNGDNEQTTASSQTKTSISPSSKHSASKSSRSSEEGLNQEIESYIARGGPEGGDRLKQPTPEGRKAPVADLLREPPLISRPFSMRDSVSPNPDTLRNDTEDSQGSSPDLERPSCGSSPQINRFSSRAPPDGCERVLSKSVPILRPIAIEATQLHMLYTLKPSSHSAFESLQRSGQVPEKEDEEEDTPIVPNQQQDLN